MLSSMRDSVSKAASKAKESALELKTKAQDATRRSSEMILPTKATVTVAVDDVPKESEESDEASLLEELNAQCKLTKRQRIYGALFCYALGGILSFFSTLLLMSHKPRQFAACYSLGSCCGIGSSMFLVGPCRQFKVMCLPVRRIAATVWISTMIVTITVAIAFPRAGLVVMILVSIQYAAMLWYGASYIPYGRTLIKKSVKRVASTVSKV